MNLSSTKAVIVGAGIGGLTAGIALKQAGFQVQVLERVSEIRAIGAGISLQTNAMAAFDRLGLCKRICSEGNSIDEAQIQYKGKILSSIPFGAMKAQLGHPFIAIHRGRLQAILVDALGEERMSTGVEVRHFEQDEHSVRVSLPSDGVVEGDFLVGADGIHSAIREHPWGSEPLRPSGYTAWRGVCRNPDLWPQGLFVET